MRVERMFFINKSITYRVRVFTQRVLFEQSVKSGKNGRFCAASGKIVGRRSLGQRPFPFRFASGTGGSWHFAGAG